MADEGSACLSIQMSGFDWPWPQSSIIFENSLYRKRLDIFIELKDKVESRDWLPL
jgi:hypothetical protein